MAHTKKHLPGTDFLLAAVLGALAFVGGSAAIVMDQRYGDGFHWPPLVALVFGVAMITLAFITESAESTAGSLESPSMYLSFYVRVLFFLGFCWLFWGRSTDTSPLCLIRTSSIKSLVC